jgi:molybdopterin converting factor small subunit
VEALSWVNKYVGGPGTGEVHLAEEVPPGSTVRDVLRRVTDRFPALGPALWQEGRPDALGDNIEVMVNHAVLGVTHDLDSELLPGDVVTLLGQYVGGSDGDPGRAGAEEGR